MLQQIVKLTGLCGLLLTLSANAQSTPDITIAAALSNLGARAGSVFAGEVTAVRHTGGVVEVDFRIDQSLKGQATGAVTLREWAGLWAAGQRRYWLGECAVVFLHAPSKTGLTSSVDGMEGILPLTPDTTDSLSVDVRRIRTRVQREAGAPMVDAPERMSIAQISSSIQSGAVELHQPVPVHGTPVQIFQAPSGGDSPAAGDRAQPIKGSPLQRYLDASE